MEPTIIKNPDGTAKISIPQPNLEYTLDVDDLTKKIEFHQSQADLYKNLLTQAQALGIK